MRRGRNYSAAGWRGLLGELEKKVGSYLAELEESDAQERERAVAGLSAAELKKKRSHS